MSCVLGALHEAWNTKYVSLEEKEALLLLKEIFSVFSKFILLFESREFLKPWYFGTVLSKSVSSILVILSLLLESKKSFKALLQRIL